MKLIAIDTALKACSVAVLDGDKVCAVISEAMERGHAEAVAPMVAAAIAQSGLNFSELERVAVTTGPGSFTGLRVGLAFARPLALALEVDCVGVSTLEALALEDGEAGYRAGAVEAPGGAYLAIYDNSCECVAPARFDLEDAKRVLAAHPGVVVRGPGAPLFGGAGTAAPDIVAFARRGAGLDPSRYRPDPLYLRAPDAKPLASAQA